MSNTRTTALHERTDRPPSWTPDAVIEGRNNPTLDVPAVQSAVDNPSFSRILLKGTFNFGDDVNSPRRTVLVRRGVELHGESLKDRHGKSTSWQTEILGGGAKMPLPLTGNTYYAESGAFKVEVSENKPVVFDGLEFRNWAATGILIRSCQGFEARNCRFAEPAIGHVAGRPPGSPPDALLDHLATQVIITPIFAIGPGVYGSFVTEDNVCVIDDSIRTDDDNFVACELTDFSRIVIAGNDIYCHDEPVNILCNGARMGPPFSSTFAITDNKVVIKWRPGSGFGGSGGIVCVANKNLKSAEITGNVMDVAGNALAFVLSGENITAKGNRVTLSPLDASDPATYPVAAFMLGINEPLIVPGYPSLGPSLSDSLFSDNHISGSALFGFFTYDLNDPMYSPPRSPLPFNESHGNTFNGNNTQHLTSLAATVYLSPHTHDNKFKGEYGSVMDLGNSNLITGYTPKTGGIGPEVSEALKRMASKRRGY